MTADPLELDAPVRLELPSELTHPRRLALKGRVLSSRSVTTADGPNFDVSIAFEPLSLSDRVTLRSVMAEQPVDFRPRRGSRRRPVGGRTGVTRVVIGRDLTGDGMRIERDPALALGDAFGLALYCSGRGEAIDLRGHIEADDDDDGWRVAFDDVKFGDLTLNTLSGNAKFILPFWRIQPYIGIGIGAQHGTFDAASGGLLSDRSNWNFASRPDLSRVPWKM